MYFFSKKLFFIVVCAVGMAPLSIYSDTDMRIDRSVSNINSSGDVTINASGGSVIREIVTGSLTWESVVGTAFIAIIAGGLLSYQYSQNKITTQDVKVMIFTSLLAFALGYLLRGSSRTTITKTVATEKYLIGKGQTLNISDPNVLNKIKNLFFSAGSTLVLGNKITKFNVGNNSTVIVQKGLTGKNITLGNNSHLNVTGSVTGGDIKQGNNSKINVHEWLSGKNIKQGNNSSVWYYINKEKK